jgi:hypothetical protein
MEIKYTITEDDYIKFNLYHILNSKTGRKSLKTQRFAVPIVYIIIAYIFANIADIPFLSILIPFALMGGLWSIFYPKYYKNFITRYTRKLIKEGKNDGLLGNHSMSLTDEGIVDISSNGETKVKWAGIIKFQEDDTNLYLYNSSVSAYIIPKREVSELKELKDYLNSKLTHLDQ